MVSATVTASKPRGVEASQLAPWYHSPFRMFQTNLLDVDADMDVEKVLDFIQDFGCDTWLVNGGGILSFYPTKLEHQTRNPYLGRTSERRPVRRRGRGRPSSRHPGHGADGFLEGQRGGRRPASGLALRRPAGRPPGDRRPGQRRSEQRLLPGEAVRGRRRDDRQLSARRLLLQPCRIQRIRLRHAYHGVSQSEASRRGFAEFSGGRKLPTGPDSPDYDLWRAYAAKVVGRSLGQRSPRTSRRGGRTRPAALRRPRLLRGEQQGRPRAVAPPRQRDDQRVPHAAAAPAGAVPLRLVHRHAVPDRERAAGAPRPAPDPGHIARREPLDLHHGRSRRDRVSLARRRARDQPLPPRPQRGLSRPGARPRMSAWCVPTRWP